MNHLISATMHKSSASSSCVAKRCNFCVPGRSAQEGIDEMCDKNLAMVPPSYNNKHINNPLNFTRRIYDDDLLRIPHYPTSQPVRENRPVERVKQQKQSIEIKLSVKTG